MSEIKIYVHGDNIYHLRIDLDGKCITVVENGEDVAGVNIEHDDIECVEDAIERFIIAWCGRGATWNYVE